MEASKQSLLSIPTEVRIKIYEALFGAYIVHIHIDKEPHRNPLGDCNKGSNGWKPYAVFLTCRQVKFEAEPILWKEASFWQHLCVKDMSSIVGLRNFLSVEKMIIDSWVCRDLAAQLRLRLNFHGARQHVAFKTLVLEKLYDLHRGKLIKLPCGQQC